MIYDIGIIGGGPGGYAGAIKASKLGFSVVLFEENKLGGICLNHGCIPTKALLKSATSYRKALKMDKLGVNVENVSFDLDKIVKRAKDVSSRLSLGIGFLMKKNKIEVVNSHAFISGKNEITAEDKKYQCNNIIIATGARSRDINGVEIDHEYIINYKDALVPKSIPKKLVIIGSGAIGMEFAEFYSSLGSKITIIEAMSNILPNEEKEVSDTMKKLLSKRGYEIITDAFVDSVLKEENAVTVTLKDGNKITADRCLVAVGVVGNIENIGLENVGIETYKNHVKTDDLFKTNVDNIYAIGDVANPPYLAHKSTHEAITCIKMIAKEDVKPINKNFIPYCTYTSPQVASFGIKEGKVGKFPLLANGKALTSGETDGFIKTYTDENSGKIVGCSMVGEDVTELISSYLALAFDGDINEIIFPHPTLSEAVIESVLNASDDAIHI